jgi:hypothetical protein
MRALYLVSASLLLSLVCLNGHGASSLVAWEDYGPQIEPLQYGAENPYVLYDGSAFGDTSSDPSVAVRYKLYYTEGQAEAPDRSSWPPPAMASDSS